MPGLTDSHHEQGATDAAIESPRGAAHRRSTWNLSRGRRSRVGLYAAQSARRAALAGPRHQVCAVSSARSPRWRPPLCPGHPASARSPGGSAAPVSQRVWLRQSSPRGRRPAVRCRAHRTDGNPCRAYAIHGGRVCWTHGGASPNAREEARHRLALAADLEPVVRGAALRFRVTPTQARAVLLTSPPRALSPVMILARARGEWDCVDAVQPDHAWLTVAEAAQRMNCSVRTIRYRIASGVLASDLHLGRRLVAAT